MGTVNRQTHRPRVLRLPGFRCIAACFSGFCLREGTSTIYGQHGHHSFDSSLLSPSNHIGQAPIQQLWHPGQRARRSPESKLLPAGKVAKHSHSSRRTTLRQLLQWRGDALPNETMASPLLILHHRGQQRGVQEEEEVSKDLESCVVELKARHLVRVF